MVLPDWECFIGITAFPGTDADRRCFIDDNDAFPVAEPVNFLCIGIMAGAEGIGVHPVQQIDIFYIKAQIQPSSVKRRILMLAEALEIKGLSIDQKLCPFDFYRAETELFCIAVFSIIYLRLIQIRSTRIRPPEVGLWNVKLSDAPSSFRHAVAVSIHDFQPDRSIGIDSCRYDTIV